MRKHPSITRRRTVVAIATPAVSLAIVALAVLSIPACAESNDEPPEKADSAILVTTDASDAADATSPSDGGDAADVALPDVPCAVGNVCHVPTPLTVGAVASMSGRTASDVWAGGPLGLAMHWDGHAWTDLTSTEVPQDLTTLSSIVLTPDDVWGVAGSRVMRRGVEPSTVRSFELFDPDHAPTSIAAFGNDEVYLGCSVGGFSSTPGTMGALFKVTHFAVGMVDTIPPPILTANDEPVQMNIRAMFAVPDRALWLVGDRGAVARYPFGQDAGLSTGIVLPLASQNNLFAAWATGDQLWAVGERGTIVHFDGTAWSEQASGTLASLNAIFGFSENDIWTAGDSGVLLHFDGKTWSPVSIQGYGGSLKTIWGAAPDDMWIGGERGMFHWGPLP